MIAQRRLRAYRGCSAFDSGDLDAPSGRPVPEFCTHKYDKQYKKHGFRCTHYNKNAHRYVLTYA